jgi:L-asparaginase II
VEEPVLVEVVRSDMVESRHRGRVVALAADGHPALSLGVVTEPIYGRSANKPLQATAMVELGLRLPSKLLALVCASHNGEPVHVAGVRRILVSAGLDEGYLQNTPDLPIDVGSARDVIRAGGDRRSILQNCSGKHAGMLATCRVNGWSLGDYLEVDHPLQRHITGTIERLSGELVAHIGVDGCGAPAHALSLLGLTRAFAAVASAPDGTAEAHVAAATRDHPDLIGGKGRDITALIKGVPGLMAKDGAEGVLAGAMADGRAAGIKITDGSRRGLAAVMLAALDLLEIDTRGAEALRRTAVLGGGRVVGAAHARPLG